MGESPRNQPNQPSRNLRQIHILRVTQVCDYIPIDPTARATEAYFHEEPNPSQQSPCYVSQYKKKVDRERYTQFYPNIKIFQSNKKVKQLVEQYYTSWD